MKTKFAVLFALLALVPFALGACGDDEDEEPTTATTTATEETDAGAGAGTSGNGSTVEFTADPGGGLSYEEGAVEAEAGAVTLELTNESQVPHDVRIEGSDGEDLGGTEEITDDETSATVDLEPGEYTYYCSVPGHREAGMEGQLTVE